MFVTPPIRRRASRATVASAGSRASRLARVRVTVQEKTLGLITGDGIFDWEENTACARISVAIDEVRGRT